MDISKLIANKGLSELEIKVLNFMLGNLSLCQKIGVRGVSKHNYTSTSTIMRLSKKLGYSGYIDMIYGLSALVKESSCGNEYTSEFLNNLNNPDLMKFNRREEVDKLLALLSTDTHKSIFIYGTGLSYVPAQYLYKKLMILGKSCIIATGSDSIGIFENNLKNIHFMIVFSKSGETPLVIDKVSMAKLNGIKTVAFTRETDNSLSSMADICFRIEDFNKLDDRNLLPNTFYPKTLMLIELLLFEFTLDRKLF